MEIEDDEYKKTELTQFVKNGKTLEVLRNKGIRRFFPVQYHTYDIVFEGHDLIGRDKTGSGKTIAYSLPVLERFRATQGFKGKTMFLIMLPTRQLATQVQQEIESLRHHSQQFKVTLLIGGTLTGYSRDNLRAGADVVVGTPGRVIDMMEKGELKLNDLQVLCLDEADEMLKQGFQTEVEKIMSAIKKQRDGKKVQNLLFSATIPPWVVDLSNQYLTEDRRVIDLIKEGQKEIPDSIKHLVLGLGKRSRDLVIPDLISVYGGPLGKTIVFAETKRQAAEIGEKIGRQHNFGVLHGDVPQAGRSEVFKCFRNGKIRCIIATNVAARGIDISEIDLVVNLQPPKDVETYIHRSGRTGRAGKNGVCITLYSKEEIGLIERIEQVTKIKTEDISIPTPHEVEAARRAKNEDIRMAKFTFTSNKRCSDLKYFYQVLQSVLDPKIVNQTKNQDLVDGFIIHFEIPDCYNSAIIGAELPDGCAMGPYNPNVKQCQSETSSVRGGPAPSHSLPPMGGQPRPAQRPRGPVRSIADAILEGFPGDVSLDSIKAYLEHHSLQYNRGFLRMSSNRSTCEILLECFNEATVQTIRKLNETIEGHNIKGIIKGMEGGKSGYQGQGMSHNLDYRAEHSRKQMSDPRLNGPLRENNHMSNNYSRSKEGPMTKLGNLPSFQEDVLPIQSLQATVEVDY